MTSTESVTTLMRRLGGAASRRVRFAARFATAGRRALPTFLVIGTQRGGTTSLFRYLAGRPQVVAPYRKEVEFFDRHFHRGPRWYRAHFPRLEQVLSQQACTFEATVNYLFDPAVPSRVSALLPDGPHRCGIARAGRTRPLCLTSTYPPGTRASRRCRRRRRGNERGGDNRSYLPSLPAIWPGATTRHNSTGGWRPSPTISC